MPMKIIETTVSKTTIRVRFSDGLDHPIEWIDFQVKLADLKLGETELQYLGELQKEALRCARATINVESERLATQASPKP
jgi:hypothetical protein